MRVAICQLNSQEDKIQNINTAMDLVRQAAGDGATLITLPEYTDYQGRKEGALAAAEPHDGETVTAFRKLASELNVNILLGSIRIQSDVKDKVFNMSFLIDRKGEIAGSYQKTHLFDVDLPGKVTYKESDTIKPGNEIVVSTIDEIKFGLSVCYDLRFPELYRLQALSGAKVLLVPAAFALYTGRDHWDVLLRARAIENQCFVVAPGQIGPYPPNGACNGRSIIVDPWGNILSRTKDAVGYSIADLDFSLLEKIRGELPSLKNRREDIYKLESNKK